MPIARCAPLAADLGRDSSRPWPNDLSARRSLPGAGRDAVMEEK